MGKLLNAIGKGVNRAAERWASDEAFRRGQNAEPPLHLTGNDDSEKRQMQELLDRRYAEGQKSVLVKIGNKLADG